MSKVVNVLDAAALWVSANPKTAIAGFAVAVLLAVLVF